MAVGIVYVTDGLGQEWAFPIGFVAGAPRGHPDGPLIDIVELKRNTGSASITGVVVLEENDGEPNPAAGLRGRPGLNGEPAFEADAPAASPVGEEGDAGGDGAADPVRGSASGGA